MAAIEGYRLVLPLRARFRDTDGMGHVNNAVYFTYLEEGRAEYFRQVSGLRSYQDVSIILARATCDFRAQVRAGEEFDLGVRVERLGTKSFDMGYRLLSREGGRLVAEASSIQVAYNYATHRSVPVPEEFRRQVEAFEGRTF